MSRFMGPGAADPFLHQRRITEQAAIRVVSVCGVTGRNPGHAAVFLSGLAPSF